MGNLNWSASSNGIKEIQRTESGNEEKSKESISTNGNSSITDCVKDGLDLNARLNLNEALDLNDGCSSHVNTENGLKERGCIDLNVDVNHEIDASGDVTAVDCPAVGISKRECNFDLNEEVCDEAKETQGDNAGEKLSDGGGLFKMGQSPKSETDINQNSVQDDSVKGNLDYIPDSMKLEGIDCFRERTGEDASVSMIEQKEDGGTVAFDSHGVSNAISSKDCDSLEVWQEHSPEAGIAITQECQNDPGSQYKQGRGRRKRRKLSENLKAAPETVLRRSSRRASALKRDSSPITMNVMDDPFMSPGPSAITEEKTVVSGSEQYEQCSELPPKLQLPPSSQNLNLDNIPILDLFSIYACLRSFSTILFLSPFELEDFVTALKSVNPNILFDNIHVSILQTLRKHLEYLSNEGCQSASDCLRNLNWDLLDLVTWPIFMAEYLLIHGSGLKTGFDLKYFMFGGDYYKQPVTLKIEILQCLCDDMMEVEAIRLELNRRSLVTEADMSFDQSMYFDICKKRRAPMDMSGGFSLSEEVVDVTTDWNSDDCYLCKMDGSLICCDGCPAAFHSRCVGVANDHLPEGDWYCPECAIGRRKPWMKPQKSLRGADLLGIDPHGRLYFDSCGYLLVSDSSDMRSLFNYYHINDLHVVIEVLKAADAFYGSILMAICKHWEIPFNLNGAAYQLELSNQSASRYMHMKTEYSAIYPSPAPFSSSEAFLDTNQAADQRNYEETSTAQPFGQEFLKAERQLDSVITTESPCVASEVSAETTKMRSTTDDDPRTYGFHDSNRPGGALNQLGIPEKLHTVSRASLRSSRLDTSHKVNLTSAGAGYTASAKSTGNRATSEMLCGTDYINYYSFARTASLVAEELIRKSPEKTNKSIEMSEEDLISEQAKAIIKKSTNFCWPSSQSVNAAARKEKCGWCFTCKVENDDRDCLFNSVVMPIQEVSKSDLVGFQPKNQNAHLKDVIFYILSLEDRLRGLLLGPWLSLHHSKNWRNNLLKASDVASIKCSLLTLESNLRPLALSADWWKHVDSAVTMGSACHIVASSRTSWRHSIGRKRARCSDIESSASSNASGLGTYWWRGGRLSRHLFNWKVLPCSLVTKAARQAGCAKIPGILYLENSDFPKRSKCVAWRAAVETSISVEQLAIQVRELDSNIRWHDIENTHPLWALDKESRKSIRLFKKVIVRRKSTERETVKYLLDFGKRRAIPDIVKKHGSLLEESSSDRKKYWLEEPYVPLHLIKNFEDKKIARKSNETKPGKVLAISGFNKRATQKRGFSYLFSRMERPTYHQCGHCNKDVLTREAVGCQYCNGFFHKRHVRKSGSTAECRYSCHRCLDGMHVNSNSKRRKLDPKLGNIQSQKGRKVPSVGRPVKQKCSKRPLSKRRQGKSQTNKKVPSSIPLRRSARKAKCLYVQKKRNVGRKKGKKSKSKKVTSRKPKETSRKPKETTSRSKTAVTFERKKRTHICNSYWLNGLRLSTKPNDERVMLFKEKKHLGTSEGLSSTFDQPKCHLCCGDACTLNYIACEICGEWFHGDAFGLTLENVRQLIGFRCHVCRDRTAPMCPHKNNNAMTHAEIKAATEYAEELHNSVSLQPLSQV
ncbi:DDT domain-containing protein PTM isoform X2 [Neltuma alba]|uniref:DDT domain-containing protein PTM isoform X2 n=1 Tax=Neltuma alba TaxID=207710 RepID=UPI0010A3B28D|nr:DDT domain-containing protein PTM-like isoform X2 [Prosopis alba]